MYERVQVREKVLVVEEARNAVKVRQQLSACRDQEGARQ